MEIECPHCKKTFEFEYLCKRCKHKWTPRYEEEPEVCPHCKSPYWNKEKVRFTDKKAKK